jgi:hypothetical protein
MSLAETYFIKTQLPPITTNDLLRLYERAIIEQGAGYTQIAENSIEFGETSSFTHRFGRKFAGFTSGRLVIRETETTFEITLDAISPTWIPLFDVYFITLRDSIERELQSPASSINV